MTDEFIQKLRDFEAAAAGKQRSLSSKLADQRARIIVAEVRRTNSVADVAARMGVSTVAVRKALDRLGEAPPTRRWQQRSRRRSASGAQDGADESTRLSASPAS